MNPNNRIQYLRKSQGLSQEELGEKMFVSRQTVSQWETGQTMPSIESLIKLREIFGVSVDEILGILPEENEEKTEEAHVAESHTFSFDADEVKTALSHTLKPIKKKLFWLWIFTVISFFIMFEEMVCAILFGVFLMYVISFSRALSAEKRSIKNAVENLPSRTYTYAVSEGELIIKISEGERFISEEHRPLEEIEGITDVEGCYILTVAGRRYIIRKSDLSADSKLFLYIKSNQSLKVIESNKARRWRSVSVTTVVASLLSVFAGLIVASVMAAVAGDVFDVTEYLWVMFLFLPIPIFSVVLGLVLKRKGMKYKKNIIVGIIMCCTLCLYGSFTSSFTDMNSALITVKDEMNVDLPIYNSYMIITSVAPKNVATMKNFSIAEMSFSFDDTVTFYNSLDERWLSEFPEEFEEIFAVDEREYMADFCLLYNVDTKEYNTVPAKGGEYDMILLMFSKYTGYLHIVNYRLIT